MFGLPPLLMALAEGEAGHAERFLGLPLWIWQLANLLLFLGVLFYFLARPLAAAFRRRQVEVEQRLTEARGRRLEAARLEAEIRERMDRLGRELSEIRVRGSEEGEREKRALFERAEQESERVRREAEAEIGRRLTEAKEELRRTAADLTSAAARQILSAQITDADRRRLLEESVGRLGGAS